MVYIVSSVFHINSRLYYRINMFLGLVVSCIKIALLFFRHQGKEYRLNLVTKKCNVTNLTRPFRPFGLPPDAQFDGAATLGAPGVPGEFITVENFSGTSRDGGRYFGLVTSPDCYPVTANFHSREGELVSFT